MRNYFFLKYTIGQLKEYIFIFLTATIFLFIPFTKSFGEENVFTINNVKVEGPIDINFSRDKYLNKAFINSFTILMNKILLTRDFKKINNIKLKQVKNLINSFQILEESYKEDLYRANIKVNFHHAKIKNFLGEKNLSFSNPGNISAVFFPLLYINNEFQNLNDNFFYNKWNEIDIENELINFILPMEDLEDISEITKMKNRIENLNVDNLVNKYNIKNYVFALIDYENEKLKIYLRTNFNNNKTRKNFAYQIQNIKDELSLNQILKDLKLQINDLWKEENLINLLMPLSIDIKFQHNNLQDLDKIRSVFYKIDIINNSSLEEFNTKNSIFKIYYYGNPKKLRAELLKLGYHLNNTQGIWQLYINE